ncbi:myb-like protein X [Halyomorpha halys]|uniref:myb-like protein X n=1 Tax=Halyomorpha halys TaxID=286706 RepID=UPI0006D5056F|nr:myb-like protein X isoform X2 [Halyomorpha halys]
MAYQCHYQGLYGNYRWVKALQLLDRGVSVQVVANAYGILPAELIHLHRNWEMMKYRHFQCSREVERQLYIWFIATVSRQTVNDNMLLRKAMEINYTATGIWGPEPSSHWLELWKERHGISVFGSSRKSSQQLPDPLPPSVENQVQHYEHRHQYQHFQPTIIQNLPVPLRPLDSSYSIGKDYKSSTNQNVVQGVLSQKIITEQQELEDEDDDVVKELDSVLSGFQHKVIDCNKESDEDGCKRNRISDDFLEPKAKVLVTEEEVAKVKDISPKNNGHNDVEMAVEQEKPYDGVTNISDIKESAETDNEGNISDEEEQTQYDADSETLSSSSVTESCDENDEELECVEKYNDSKKNDVTKLSNGLPIPISDSDDEKEQQSGIDLLNKKKTGKKIGRSDKDPILKIKSSSDANEDSKNTNDEKMEVTNSVVSGLEESQVIVVDSSSEEESDEENDKKNENEESDEENEKKNENDESDEENDKKNENEESDDDDVILIENKSETIVIDTSDEEEEEEKCYQEEPQHQLSKIKIILLNTKEGGKEFSIVESESLKTEPKVVIFDEH